eukprot:TRINITY_DN17144_c0_g2_i1.p1 TRINITY_DN17144_c0_g2~~TRINITY_DN17144_c0_g2_i1.p1  ORF type:complete len:896 (+),score=213.74 TRINITY_DN17144_c0_g2_i1:66-2690(+)
MASGMNSLASDVSRPLVLAAAALAGSLAVVGFAVRRPRSSAKRHRRRKSRQEDEDDDLPESAAEAEEDEEEREGEAEPSVLEGPSSSRRSSRNRRGGSVGGRSRSSRASSATAARTAEGDESTGPPLALTAPAPALQDQAISVRDLEALIGRAVETRRNEMVADGLASIRHALGQKIPDVASRMGVMTGSKVCEIHKMLVDEMEVSMKEKIGWLSGIFHSWRAEANIQLTGRSYETKLKNRQGEWEKYLLDERGRYEHEAKEAANRWAVNDAKWRQAAGLMLDQWAHGDQAGLLSSVVRCWRGYTEARHAYYEQEKRLERVAHIGHGMVLKWIEDDDTGAVHACFLSWKTRAAASKAERETRRTMEDMLNDERRKHSDSLDDLRTDEQRARDQHRAVVTYALARWELGDERALSSKLFSAWSECTRQAKRLAKERQAVHLALLRSFDGDQQGTLHACMLNWKACARHERLAREGDQRLIEERQRWEKLLEDRSRSHEDGLKDMMSEAEAKKARAHEATTLMLRQWLQGNTKGLLTTVLAEWRRFCEAVAADKLRRQTVHAGVLRFLEGERLAGAHMCLLNWKQYTKVQAVYNDEVAERERTIAKLQEKTKSVLGSEQQRLLRYMRMLFAGDNAALQLLVLNRWRIEAHGVLAAEEKRKLEVTLQERERLSQLAQTKHRQNIAAALHVMNSKDSTVLALDFFLGWKHTWQQAKQQWAHQLNHTKAVTKFAKHHLGQMMKQDVNSLLGAVFWELLRECRQARHEREREEARANHENATHTIVQITEERNDLQDELQIAYREIDRLTDTLQRELKTKETLAFELAEVHKERRRTTRTHSSTTVTTTLTAASSASAPFSSPMREIPHLARKHLSSEDD